MPRSFLLPLTLATALLFAGCDRQSEGEAQQQENSAPANEETLTGTLDRGNAGSTIPEMVLSDPQGIELDLSQLGGTPVLLNLWATWCAPCVVEMPMLDKLAEEMQDELRVITVSQDLQGADKVAPFFAERDFRNLQPWLDPDSELADHFGGGGAVLPTTVLYGADGKEIWRMIGGYDWSSDEAKALVDEALGGETETEGV